MSRSGQKPQNVGATGLDRAMAAPVKISLVHTPAPEQIYKADVAQESVLKHCSTNPHRPLVVFGGPGTGKTSTLIRSVISRINEGANPNSILILTYGRESASRLRDEIVLHTDSTAFEPLARTFHSLAFSILNDPVELGDNEYVLISGAEQDAFIRELLRNPDNFGSISWPKDLELALGTRGFAREIRDLILRANERNLSYNDLAQLGEKLGEKYWPAAIDFWKSYDDIMALRFGNVPGTPLRIDPSSIIVRAIEKLQKNPDLLARYRATFPTIYVDEFQESDASHRALLRLLTTTDLTIFADGDSAIGRFRGADPESMRDIPELFSAEIITLETPHRFGPEIADLSAATASKIRTFSPSRKKYLSASERPESINCIDVRKLATQSDCANYIAHAFRSAHLRGGIAWSDMAIILRSPGAGVSALTRAFALNGIPVDIDSSATALAENPVIRPILIVARIATGTLALTPQNWEVIEDLLRSPLGGADSLSMRTMRLALNKAYHTEIVDQELAPEEIKSSVEILLESLTVPVTYVNWQELAPLKRINDLITAAKKSLEASSDISDLLWAIWSAAKDYEGSALANSLRTTALRGGVRGASADRDLDAVMQLFESARRFSERMPGSNPSLFIEEISGETILSDSITAQGDRGDVVTITTVHSAKGLQWKYVALMGLQEGIWPNLRQRGSLLGSERLVESIRTGFTARDALESSAASALIDDERRLFHVALSRASEQLIAVGYSEEDSEPSIYFEELFEYVHGADSEAAETTELSRALTSHALVAVLRRNLLDPDYPNKEFAASLLARLSTEGIESADPKNWWGYSELSSTAPIIAPGEEIVISPSNLQSFSECQLKWFLERNGGRDGDSSAALIGSAIHALASLLHHEPDVDISEMQDRLAANWKMIDRAKGWVKEYELDQASEKLKKFFAWHRANTRQLIGVEEKFETVIGNVRLKGTVDRLEIDSDGKVYIVDLKSGASDATKETVQSNMQLAGYQLAIARDGFVNQHPGTTPGGAELVFLGGTTNSASVKTQFAINVDETEEKIIELADLMSGATFTATINSRCRTCGVKSMCPLQPQGRSVIDEN